MKIFALVLTYNSAKFIKNVLKSIPKNSFDKIIFNAINSATERSIQISKEINNE